MGTEYSDAHEVEEIAEELIADHYHELEGLPIRFVWRSKASAKNGKTVLGKARVVSGLNAFLARSNEPFHVIEIAADEWKALTPEQRRALVDHELAHCVIDEEGRAKVQGHDVEEFAAVVTRHGLWKPDLQFFGRAVQAQLPGLEGAE